MSSQAEAFGFMSELVAGARGLNRLITHPSIQKTGLALVGLHQYLHTGRLLILAESEIRYIESLGPEEREAALHGLFSRDLPCVLITENLDVPGDVTQVADRAAIPVLRTSLDTPVAIARLTSLLDDLLAPRDTIHGVLLDVLGLGVLLVGESGLGKSECALDLVGRGHRLVADDAVDVKRRGGSVVLGTCPEPTRHHMEIRGIGIINITQLFGVAATRSSKRVELVVQLERWNSDTEYDRLGLDDQHYEILGTPIPMLRMPVAPGRNLAILVEVAARNRLLRERGHHPARDIVERLDLGLRHAPDSPVDG